MWSVGRELWSFRPCRTSTGDGAVLREKPILYLINVFFCFRVTDWLVSSLKHNVLLCSIQRGKVRGKRKRGEKALGIQDTNHSEH